MTRTLTVITVCLFFLIGATPCRAADARCPYTVATGDVVIKGPQLKATRFNLSFSDRPRNGAEVLLLPYPTGNIVRSKIMRSIHVDETDWWEVTVEPSAVTALSKLSAVTDNGLTYIDFAALMSPLPGAPRVIAQPKDLPPAVTRSLVDIAVDLTGDTSPEIVIWHQCPDKAHLRPDGNCDTKYQMADELFERINGTWQRCGLPSP